MYSFTIYDLLRIPGVYLHNHRFNPFDKEGQKQNDTLITLSEKYKISFILVLGHCS